MPAEAEVIEIPKKELSRLSSMIVNQTVYDRVFRLFDRVYEPDKVERVLKGALNGDLNDQMLLFDAMLDTWPELQGAIGDMADDISGGAWEIQPDEDDEQSQMVAEDIEAMLMAMRGSQIKRLNGLCDTMKSLVYGYYYGHVVLECQWESDMVNGSSAWAIKSTKEVDPIYYRYPYKGQAEDRLMFAPNGRRSTTEDLLDFAPNKFLIGINRGHRAHPALAAPLRSLVGYWLAANFGLKWFMQFAQLYGIPLRWGTFDPSDKCAETLLASFLENLGAAGWAAFPKGTEVNIEPGATGQGTPQDRLIELANKAVSRFIYGATLTTDVGDSGSRALGDVHQKSKDRKTNAVWCYVADIINDQLIPAIIQVNGYPDIPAPKMVRPVDVSITDQVQKAELHKALFSSSGLKLAVAKHYIYEQHGIPMPADDDELYEPVAAPSPFGMPGQEEPGERPAKGRVVPEEEEDEEDQVAAIKANRKTLNSSVLDQLHANVERDIPQVAGGWLEPVKPIFEKLVAAALNESTGLDEFQRLLVEAQNEIPEVELNTNVLQDALERAIGTAMLAGAGQRAIDFKP